MEVGNKWKVEMYPTLFLLVVKEKLKSLTLILPNTKYLSCSDTV